MTRVKNLIRNIEKEKTKVKKSVKNLYILKDELKVMIEDLEVGVEDVTRGVDLLVKGIESLAEDMDEKMKKSYGNFHKKPKLRH